MRTDQRKRPRRALSYRAHLTSMDGSRLFLCSFLDVSEHGARLLVEDAAAVPEEVMLMLAGPRGAKRHCRVVWRDSDRIGVTFVAKPRDDGMNIR